jgi:hypothetical protein
MFLVDEKETKKLSPTWPHLDSEFGEMLRVQHHEGRTVDGLRAEQVGVGLAPGQSTDELANL